MRYVIKQQHEFIGTDTRYARLEAGGPGFNYPTDIEQATQFDTIDEAVAAIIDRTRYMYNVYIGSDDGFTIAGIREVSTLRYEEVAL